MSQNWPEKHVETWVKHAWKWFIDVFCRKKHDLTWVWGRKDHQHFLSWNKIVYTVTVIYIYLSVSCLSSWKLQICTLYLFSFHWEALRFKLIYLLLIRLFPFTSWVDHRSIALSISQNLLNIINMLQTGYSKVCWAFFVWWWFSYSHPVWIHVWNGYIYLR